MILIFIFAIYLPVVVVVGPLLYMMVRWQDINTPDHKHKRTQTRENDAMLRPEFDEIFEEWIDDMSPADRAEAVRLARWTS